MSKIKNPKPEEETQIILDENGYCGVKLDEETLIEKKRKPLDFYFRNLISTKSEKYETAENKIILPFWKFYFQENLFDYFNPLNILRNEIEQLKKENEEIKQILNELSSDQKIIKLKEKSDHDIEKIIIKYLKKNKGKEVFPSDIAFEYHLDARKVFDISQKLKKEGKII